MDKELGDARVVLDGGAELDLSLGYEAFIEQLHAKHVVHNRQAPPRGCILRIRVQRTVEVSKRLLCTQERGQA